MSVAPEFSRPLALDRIGAAYETEVAATAEECAALARRLGVPSVASLACRFRLRRGAAGRIAAEAELRARLTRECVVTLDAFEADVAEAFSLVFVPEGTESDDPDPESDDEIPYAGTALDLGEAAAEQLALTLDPYPHKPGAELPAEAEKGPESPFAALARRRDG
jgi:uncharacterized metal-binding protein YceD (DUF177 family)